MKNLTKIFMAVVAGMFAFSCVTDTTEDLGVNVGGKGGVYELSVSLEEATKTQLGEKVEDLYPLYWSEGDAISVNGVVSNPLTADGSANAVFKFNEEVFRPYCGVYPASAAVAVEEGEVVEPEAPVTVYPVTFAAEQPYTVGTFAPQAAPMYGYAAELAEGEAESAIQLNHLTGVLRLAVAGNGEKVTSIAIKTQKGKIAGPFTVDCSNGALLPQEGAVGTITVTCGEGLVLGAEATPVYVTVPAGNYGTFVITVNTEAHGKMTVKFDSDSKAIAAGVVREFKEFVYEANTNDTEEVYLIDSEEALIEFARIASTFYPRTEAKVVANLDMSGYDWTPIKNFGEFVFDGGSDEGYTISGLTAPLFDKTAATVKNVKLTNVNYTVTDLTHSGAIACHLYGNMENCSATGSVNINNTTFAPAKITNQYEEICHAGLVGLVHGGTVTDCVNDVDITVTSLCEAEKSIKATVGGVVGGASAAAQFNNLTNNGDITYAGTTQKGNVYISGVVGKSNTTEGEKGISAMNNCTNNGAISTTASSVSEGSLILTGITGDLYAGVDVVCDKLVNNGAITHCGQCGNLSVAGIIGYRAECSFTNCKNTGNFTVKAGAVTKVNRLTGIITDTWTGDLANNLSNSGNLTIEKATTTTNYIAGIGGGTTSVTTYTNCSNSGKLSVASQTTATDIYMMGHITGTISATTISGCTNTGSLTVGDEIALTDYVQVAGLFNGVQGKGGVSPTISDCSNSGALSVGSVNVNSTDKNHSRIYMSGLIATLGAGAMENCYNEATGTITSTNSTSANEYMVGGLIGYISYQNAIADQVISLTDCENKANISLVPTKVAGAYVGGVAGQAWAEKTDQTVKFVRVKNSGNLNLTGATWGTPYIGGIWAQPNNYSVVELDGCENSGNITFNASQKNKPYIGGIIGHETNKKSVLIKKCTNKGNITLSSSASATRIAGILGSREQAQSTVTLDGCTNLGTVKVDAVLEANTVAWAVGGMVGYFTSGPITVKDCTNGSATDATKGTVTIGEAVGGVGVGGIIGLGNNTVNISGCKNYGNVSQTGIGGYYLASPKTNRYVGIGGIFGYNQAAGTNISNCENHGLVEYGTAAANNRTNIGGIWGLATAGTEAAPNTVTSCKNYGTVKYAGASCGMETTVAGIIGFPQGKTVITNCENTSTGVVWGAGKCSSNYDIGGVVGGPNSSLVDITYCTNNGTVQQTKTNNGQNYIGGIVGYAYTWGVLSHCTNNGAIETVGSSSSKRDYVGGIVGYARHMSGNSEISNCVNTYPLVFTGKAGTVYHGGIIGAMTHEDTTGNYTFVTENLYNLADLTFKGSTSGSTIKVGGIAGYIQSPISNSYCYANLKAIGLEGNIGVISGSARMSNKNEKVLNCGIGGNLIFGEKEDIDASGDKITVDALTPVDLTMLYSVAIDEALAIEEGNSILTSKPATPDYTYTPAQ